MTMKIQGQQPALDNEAAQRTDAVRKTEVTAAEKAAVTVRKGDSVEVSSDARLLADALKAVGNAPDIRPEVVDRMRKLVESGELGKDSSKLADRLIDHLLEP